MSKFKKVISLVLCFAMLAGTFAFLGDLIVPSASAATGTSKVKTYEELDKQYDGFVYVGIDVVEVTNGELTDGYVNAGDWLEYHLTILSDLYVGTFYPFIVYEKDFFDVRVISSTTPSTSETFENADYEGNNKCADGSMMNKNHPYNIVGDMTSTLTSMPAAKMSTQLGNCSIDSKTYSNWDFVKSTVAVITTSFNHPFAMTADEWMTKWYVRVKTGLADGVTGESFSPVSIWRWTTAKGFADCTTVDSDAGTNSSAKSLSVRKTDGMVKTFMVDDTYHTFTIGTNPADVEKPAEKKAVNFIYVDGSEIVKGEYEKDATVEVPKVDGLVTWVDDSTGKAVELGESFVMGEKVLTYKAVLDTDKFDVKINLNNGEFAEDAVLPEGATVENGTLTVKAGFGETYDLTALPLPEREGYTASWNPETVTIDSINGANAAVKWTIEKYKATFYLDKEAYDSGAASVRAIDFTYGNKVPFTTVNSIMASLKPEKKFAGWINATTGEKANEETIYSEDVAFYADWTDFNSTITIWGRDYENGGWKELATKHADAGATLKLNDVKALVNEDNYGTAAVEYTVSASASTFSENTAIRKDITFAEGNQDVYVFTTVKFNVTWKTPVLDEDGFVTEEYNEEKASYPSNATSEDGYKTASAAVKDVTTPAGYEFAGWVDAEGNTYTSGTIALDIAKGTDYELTATFNLVEYSFEFIVNNSVAIKEKLTVKETVTLGDTINLSALVYYKADGTEGLLPEIGKENKEQAGGPYRNADGYKFLGWKAGLGAANEVDLDITKDIVITKEIIAAYASSGTFAIKGYWEALYYDFVAYYSTGETDAEGKLVYKAMPAVQVQTGASLDSAYAAALETVNSNLPEGKRFYLWKLEDGSTRPTNMPAYGTEVYAYYVGKPLSLYIDYNYSTEEAPLELKDTMNKSTTYGKYLFDGVDVENDVPEGELGSIADMIRSSTVSEANSPGVTYEVVGWKIYYVVNEEDVYNKDKWVEGISDIAGSTIAKYTLIFQVEWKAHKDFLFRVYNTDGALYMAVDKKFNKYYWYMDKPADKENAVALNTLPERLIILGFLPKLDGFDFDRFFEADMWSNLSIRVDPISLSKAWLNPKNWGALIEALIGGLSSGFGGAI